MTEELSTVVSEFRKVLEVPDPAQLHLILGTMAANRIKDEAPVWMIIVGPPSSGKSAPLRYLKDMPDTHVACEITAPGLLSCSPRKEKKSNSTGGLLKRMGNFGIIIVPDMSPTLSLPPDRLAQFLSIMRDVYDGTVVRHGGQDGGMTIDWTGKVGFIAASTGDIDRHHSIINALGDRYLYFRMPKTDIDAKLKRVKMRGENSEAIRKAVLAVLSQISTRSVPEIDEETESRLSEVAKLVAICRTAVVRDGVTREVEHIGDPEEPMRLYSAFRTLYRGLVMAGLTGEEASQLTCRVGFDSMPPARMAILRLIASTTEPVTVKMLASLPGLFSETIIRRALEDLSLYSVIKREGQNGVPSTFTRSDWLAERLSALQLT